MIQMRLLVTQLTDEYAHVSVYDENDTGAGTVLLKRTTFDKLCGEDVFADRGDTVQVEWKATGVIAPPGGSGESSSRTARADHAPD